MPGLGKKPPALATFEFAVVFDGISKAALIDALWCACQLGTDESDEQIFAQAARNAQIALRDRGDRCPQAIAIAAAQRIDSDGEAA